MNAYEGGNNVNLRTTLLRIRQNNGFTLCVECQRHLACVLRLRPVFIRAARVLPSTPQKVFPVTSEKPEYRR